MIVEVDTEQQTARLTDAPVFTAFHVAAAGGDTAAVLSALGAAGAAVDDDHVWVAVAAVRAWADGDADWEANFAAMLGYAATKGWLNDDESMIQAHIEWA